MCGAKEHVRFAPESGHRAAESNDLGKFSSHLISLQWRRE
jgi:hypothetical protein